MAGDAARVLIGLFRARQADLLARGEAAGHREHTAATLCLALSRLERDAPAAAGLLRLLAFLAPEPVPLDLLLGGREAAQRLGEEVAGAVGPLLSDPLAAGDAEAALRQYSLAVQAGDGPVQVHRLVQAVTRAQAGRGCGLMGPIDGRPLPTLTMIAARPLVGTVTCLPRSIAEWQCAPG